MLGSLSKGLKVLHPGSKGKSIDELKHSSTTMYSTHSRSCVATATGASNSWMRFFWEKKVVSYLGESKQAIERPVFHHVIAEICNALV